MDKESMIALLVMFSTPVVAFLILCFFTKSTLQDTDNSHKGE